MRLYISIDFFLNGEATMSLMERVPLFIRSCPGSPVISKVTLA